MTVDPDDCTFWYTNEYLPNTDSFNWKTRIGSFRFPGCGGGGGGGGGGAVTNGDFETGALAPWSAGGKPTPKLVSSPVHGGSKAAQLGSTSAKQGDSKLKQTVTVPIGSPHLTFFYWPQCKGTLAKDQIQMEIRNTGGSTLATVLNVCQNLSSWQSVDVDMSAYAGQTVILFFKNHDDGKSGQPTYFVVDDVSLS
jgi:serine protease